MSEAPNARAGARIEGGFDAVVVGAGFDALVAASLLAKAGMKTVLAGAGVQAGKREFAPGHYCVDGEFLVRNLDMRAVDALELYRNGLRFAQRRLDTEYRFADGGALLVDGDLFRARESVVAMAPAEAGRFAEFLESALDAARAMRPFFEGDLPPRLAAPLARIVERFLGDSARSATTAAFDDPHLQAMVASEAVFRRALRPGDAFSAAGLLERWSGETAGLQAAIACVEGGADGLERAARRAAQALGVDLRSSAVVEAILVERDRAAGVRLADGGQIRAHAVVAAAPARHVFAELIGPALLDIEFEAALSASPPACASARANVALDSPVDERAATRRFFAAPGPRDLLAAYGAARRGEVGSGLIVEAAAVGAIDRTLAPQEGATIAAILHPVPARLDESLRAKIGSIAMGMIEGFAPRARAVAIEVRDSGDEPTLAAAPSVFEAWARARRLTGASRIGGFFFCGSEAQNGPGMSGAAARRAADDAVRYLRKAAP